MSLARVLTLLGLASGLSGLACASAPTPRGGHDSPEAGLLLSEPFETLEGAPLSLAEHRGKVLLVDFFATWCLPCADSLPVYDAWQRELGPQGFQVVAVSVDEHPEEVPAFMARHAPGLLVVRDPAGRVAERVRLEGMPTAFLIDRGGRLALRHEGFRPGDASRLRAEIDAALLE